MAKGKTQGDRGQRLSRLEWGDLVERRRRRQAWTRNIHGIDGSLCATQHNSEAAVLQLHDLEGNIVATAAVSETETKPLTTYNPTEFGVPVNGTPPTKFSWLADAGGSVLKSEYYVDGQVYKQSQGEGVTEKKLEYKLDPEERTLETITSGETSSTVVSHYDGSGGALAWTGEGSEETEKWNRSIPGIDGTLTATQVGEGKTGGAVTLQLHDLQGNVVGTVGNSETETKLLTKYNSTEFGVPSGKEAPPKYAWLGADGVAGELPSGVITQDGVTYVPQTGRPLQTEGITLPAPENAATPFTRPFEAWIGITAGEGIAREVSAAEQERKKREEANQPPGMECDEETEGCGPDPAHGPNPWECKVWASWGHGLHLNEYLAVHGHWSCEIAPAHIEVQVALMEVVGNHYVQFEKAGGKTWNYPGEGAGKTGSEFSKGYTCIANHWYQAWVWGRTWDGWTNHTTWYATAEDGHWDMCPEGINDPTQGPDQFTYK